MRMMSKATVAFCVICCALHLASCGTFVEQDLKGLGGADEQRLLDMLFERGNYHAFIKPVMNITDQIEIKFGVALIQLISVEEKQQVMKTNLWLRIKWHDYRLTWNKADYGDIGVIRVPPDKIWNPDIVLINNADGHYEVSYKSNVLVYHTGEVNYIPPTIYKSTCSITVEYFPFDIQSCNLEFSSWTYSGDEYYFKAINTQKESKAPFINLNDYVLSAVWDVIGMLLKASSPFDVPGKIDFTESDGVHRSGSRLIYTVFLRRKTLFYVTTLIIPCVLIALLTVFTPFEYVWEVRCGF